MHLSRSFQISSKRRRAESFEACCQWALLGVRTITLLFTNTAQKYIKWYPSVVIRMRILKVQVNELYVREGGEQTGVPGEIPDNQPENRYHIRCRGGKSTAPTGNRTLSL